MSIADAVSDAGLTRYHTICHQQARLVNAIIVDGAPRPPDLSLSEGQGNLPFLPVERRVELPSATQLPVQTIYLNGFVIGLATTGITAIIDLPDEFEPNGQFPCGSRIGGSH